MSNYNNPESLPSSKNNLKFVRKSKQSENVLVVHGDKALHRLPRARY